MPLSTLLSSFAWLQRAHEPSAAGLMGLGCGFILLSLIVGVVLPILCFWRILSKAGYSCALALLCLVPGVGMIIVLCILAFGTWPNERR